MANEKKPDPPNYDGYEHLLQLALNGLKSDKMAEWATAHMAVSRIRIDADLQKGRSDAFALVARGLQKAFDVEAKHRSAMSKHEAREMQMSAHPAYRDRASASAH
jgi:hypothetical protein